MGSRCRRRKAVKNPSPDEARTFREELRHHSVYDNVKQPQALN
jgi:hypothetical protein